ncbi:hypothetical protein ABES25_03115 [Bacillus gobiensis]|uniref:hypothetical protein n=1 Tax=Bacillus gobiensis TaxID=1441095 RepID=UPI003D1FFDDF
MTTKRTYCFFTSYVAVLIVSVILFYALPAKENAVGGRVQSETANKGIDKVYNAAQEGRIEEINSKYKKQQWEFPYKESRLHLDGNVDPTIVVERKQSSDGTIDAIFFATDFVVGGFDMSNRTPAINLELEGDTLMIDNTGPLQINLGMYSKEFPIRQFTGEQFIEEDPIVSPMQIIYLRVPKDLEITGASDMDITYVNK